MKFAVIDLRTRRDPGRRLFPWDTLSAAPAPDWVPFPRRQDQPAPEEVSSPRRRLVPTVLAPTLNWMRVATKRRELPEPAPAAMTPTRNYPAGLYPGFRQPRLPTLVHWDRQASVDTRSHQKAVAQMVNALIRRKEIHFESEGDFRLGYDPAAPNDWLPFPPATVGAALDRIAAALAALGSRP